MRGSTMVGLACSANPVGGGTPARPLVYVWIWIFGVALAGMLVLGDLVRPAGRSVIKISATDPVYYYATTHSILFDADFDLSNQFRIMPFEFQPPPSEWPKWSVRPETGLPGTPFPIGFSILQVPFLLMGNTVGAAATGQSDGWSRACTVSFFIGIIAELCLGMTLLAVLLRNVGRCVGATTSRVDFVSTTVTLAVWPSTSLGYYTFSPMSHVASFMTASFFLLVWWWVRDTRSLLGWLVLGFAGGVLTLCRWEAAVFMVVPFVYDVWHLATGQGAGGAVSPYRWLGSRLLAIVAFLVTVVPQLAQWRQVYGRWLTIPQGSGFMEFPPLYVGHVLFSSQHGWFVWTPVTLIGLSGLLYGVRRLPGICSALLAPVVLLVAAIGAQPTNWHHIQSFGIRSLIPLVPIIAIGLALLLFNGSRLVQRSVLGLVAVCAVYTLIFAIQYRLDLVPMNDRLTFDELITDKVFLKAAYDRGRTAKISQKELENANPKDALEVARQAIKESGADRRLLTIEIQAYEQLNDPASKASAEQRLRRLLNSRLW